MRARGFTLIEMLTAVAALMIVAGLMVSLSRHVRATSANELTRKLLQDLAVALQRYVDLNGGNAPDVTPLLPPVAGTNEPDQAYAANHNSAEILRALRRSHSAGMFLSGLPEWMFDQAYLRDAWGTPIIYVRSMHPQIGMAPLDKPFFFSAGPDRKFLTRDDNLYSYEESRQ